MPRASRLLCGLAALLVVLVAACSTPPEVPLGPDGEPDPVLQEGRDVFSGRCAGCHGNSGGGGTGPNIQGERMLERYPDIADQMAVVRNGKGSKMPAFGDILTEPEIEAVVRYTREVL